MLNLENLLINNVIVGKRIRRHKLQNWVVSDDYLNFENIQK
jgi:hypothetical protein